MPEGGVCYKKRQDLLIISTKRTCDGCRGDGEERGWRLHLHGVVSNE